ncbi:UPF0613 protein PB24D3.06c [Lachnellula suecica]|uniref:UPF0613 protein PB24D3.06c n=1 Tax=Lachnellula suecica TaxID=602035 RepID=A0A8T9C9H5_9HELO|nr:UPF0613 protein PB24D3.06c [Lachnellula suecica]
MISKPRSHPGILHHYTENLVAFEYTTTSPSISKPHSILFIGGLGDGLATTSYTTDIIHALQPTPWSFFSLVLSSSYSQWGELKASCGKIVLMGHSTGSQAVLHYLYNPNPHDSAPAFDPELRHPVRPALDGAIMQAPVSDREELQMCARDGFGEKSPAEVEALFREIEAIVRDGARGDQAFDTLLPLALTSPIYGRVPISCRRFMSLLSPTSPSEPHEDDLFSSDLSDERLAATFGMVATRRLLKGRLLVLVSGADQSVPEYVDKEDLLSRWRNAANQREKESVWDDEYSGVIPGASHALSDGDQEEPRKDLVKRILGYIHCLEQ